MIFSTFLSLILFFHEPEIVDPKLCPGSRGPQADGRFSTGEGSYLGRSGIVLPVAATDCCRAIVGEDVRSVTVCVRDRETRAAGSIQILRFAFGTEFVFGVWLYRDELNDSYFRGILPIEGDGKRSAATVKLTRIDGEGSMWVRRVPPVKATVQHILFESPVYDQVLTRREDRPGETD